mmetsp:Transcript_19354/g.67400  ORF Transcript_19354/g.67400 Transcript_19354/m.67400 type:complete len:107 (-) Transcript_19354:70-390(-)
MGGAVVRRAQDARRRESDVHGHRCEDDGGGDFHESEIEKHFEQNTKGEMNCEWTFERAVGRTARPCARVDAQARSEVHGIMHGPTCAQGRRTTRSSQRSPSRSWRT